MVGGTVYAHSSVVLNVTFLINNGRGVKRGLPLTSYIGSYGDPHQFCPAN